DAFIVGHHSNLCAHAGVSGGALDFQQALLDFGNFVFEQLANELGSGARQNYLLTAGGMIDPQYPGANSIPDPDILFGYGFAARQTCFDLSGFNNGIALVHPFNRAGDDVLATLQEVVQDLLTFGVANL